MIFIFFLRRNMGCFCSCFENRVTPRKRYLPQEQAEIVQESWVQVEQQKEKFGVYVYNSFLSREKEVRRMFPRMVVENGKESFRVDKDELRRHALLVMDGVGMAVDCLGDPDKLSHFLRIIGLKHNRAGVKPDLLMKLYPEFAEALRKLLGWKYKRRTRRAWREFFLVLVEGMKVGMVNEGKSGNFQLETKCPYRTN